MTFSETISLSTKGFSDIIDITDRVVAVLKRCRIQDGLVTVFCPGSTGALTTIEYESGVLRDLKAMRLKRSSHPTCPTNTTNAGATATAIPMSGQPS